MPRKWRETRGQEDRECDGRIALRKSGRRTENSRRWKELETGDRECVREKTKKEMMVTIGQPYP